MKNTRFHLLSLLLITGLLLAACGGGTSATPAPQPTKAAAPSQTKEATESADLVLDSANETGDKARTFVSYLYEGLVRIQDDAPVGVLAESFTVSEDGLDYIFNLRPGVTFHDGSALSADMVIANFNRWFDPADANRGSGDFATWAEKFGGFKGEVTEEGKAKSIYDGIEKVDNLTVLIHLNTPDADFLSKLSDPAFSIVSPNAFSGGDGGSGAYQLSSLSGSTATLEPFAAYWNASAIPSKGIEVSIK
jgi:peptide/nickel transport system substrate-binding protein